MNKQKILVNCLLILCAICAIVCVSITISWCIASWEDYNQIMEIYNTAPSLVNDGEIASIYSRAIMFTFVEVLSIIALVAEAILLIIFNRKQNSL